MSETIKPFRAHDYPELADLIDSHRTAEAIIQMEDDFRKICREREASSREAREAFDSMCGNPMEQLTELINGLKGEK